MMEGMARNLDVSLVRTFVAVAESASMTRAANALHLTQGAVSQQVKRLEDALGCGLFERDRRGLRLTPGGERLFGRAKRLLALHDEIWAEMADGAVAGRVRLGLPDDLAGTCLAPLLKSFADGFPRVEVSLTCGSSPDLVAALAAGQVDLVVAEGAAGPSTGECLGVERLVWVGAGTGSAYLKRPLPVSLVSDTCAFRPAVLSALRAHDLPWRMVFEGGLAATTATVLADLAVTARLASTVQPGFRVLPPGSGLPPLPSFAVNLHGPSSEAGAAARGLARCIRDGMARRWQAPP